MSNGSGQVARFTDWIVRLVMASMALAASVGIAMAQVRLDAKAIPERADAWLKAYAEAGDFSGVVLLAQGDTILFQKAYGLADPQLRSPNRTQTRFRVASLSKTFTAAAIEHLVGEGKLRYSDKLSKFVPGIPNGDSITIEQLLTHESGVGVLDTEDIYRQCISRGELTRRLQTTKPLFAAGSNSEYSNEGYFLLAGVIERVSGESYADYLRKIVFAPLHMENSGTACRDLPEGHNAYGSVATATEARVRPLPFNEAAMDGPGSVFSNAPDLYLWLRAVDTNLQHAVDKLNYPYGWGKRKYSTRELIEQSGQLEGFVSHMAVYPKEHIYAIVLSNVQSGISQRIPRDLEAVLFGGTVSQPPVVKAMTLGERSMRQYVGTYHSKGTPYPQTLAIQDGQLAMHWDSDPFWREMAMTDGDTFFLRAEYARIHFQRAKDGFVHRMIWDWPGGAHLEFDKDEIKGNPAPAVPDQP